MRADASALNRQKTLPAQDDGGPSDRHHRWHGNERIVPAHAGAAGAERADGRLIVDPGAAPIFAVALATHRPLTAFFAGVATALGAGVSMAFSEGLSDTGDLTGRGRPVLRGAITGGGTFAGGSSTPFRSSSPATSPRSAPPSRWWLANWSSSPGCGASSSTPAPPGRCWRSRSAERSSPP